MQCATVLDTLPSQLGIVGENRPGVNVGVSAQQVLREKGQVSGGVSGKERFDLVAAGQRVGVTQREQLAAILVIEHQVGEQVAAGTLGRTEAAQQVSHPRRQPARIRYCKLPQVPRWPDDQRVDMKNLRVRVLDRGGKEVEDAVQALHALQIRAEIVEEDA